LPTVPRKTDVLLPVLLSAAVFPGAGQLRNGDRGKGIALIVATLAFLLGATALIVSDLMPLVRDPPELGVLVPIVTAAVTATLGTHALALGVLVALWVYSIVDAYFVASARRDRGR
jgi:hypothetical protein